MMKQVKKVFGENPETVTVLTTQVTFDENGDAEVEDEIADVLAQIPGYEVVEEALKAQSKDDTDEDPSEDDNQEDDSEEVDSSEDEKVFSEDAEEEEPSKPVKAPSRPRKSPRK